MCAAQVVDLLLSTAEFSNLTIVKYPISWNDDPTEARKDFFNPNLGSPTNLAA